MSVKERKRSEVLSVVEADELLLVKPAELLKHGYRQAKRIAARRRLSSAWLPMMKRSCRSAR